MGITERKEGILLEGLSFTTGAGATQSAGCIACQIRSLSLESRNRVWSCYLPADIDRFSAWRHHPWILGRTWRFHILIYRSRNV